VSGIGVIGEVWFGLLGPLVLDCLIYSRSLTWDNSTEYYTIYIYINSTYRQITKHYVLGWLSGKCAQELSCSLSIESRPLYTL